MSISHEEAIYGDLVRRHMYAMRDKNESLRLRIWDAIELLREIYPDACQAWDEKYSPVETNPLFADKSEEVGHGYQ